MNDGEFLRIPEDEVRRIAESIADALLTTEPSTIGLINSLEELEDLERLVSSCAGITDPIGQLKSWLSDTLNSIASWIADTVSSAVKGFIDSLSGTISGLIGGLRDFISSMISSVLSAIADLKSTFNAVVLKPIEEMINRAIEFVSKIPELLRPIETAISNAISGISSIVKSVSEQVSSMIATIVNEVKKALSPIFGIAKTLQDTLTGMIRNITSWISSIKDTLAGMLGNIASVIGKIVDSLRASLEGVFQRISSWLSTIGSALSQAQKLLTNFITTLTEAPKRIPDIIFTVATSVWEKVIKPVFDWIYTNIIDPLKKGIESIVEKVSIGFSEIAKTFMGFVNTLAKLPEMFWKLMPKEIRGLIEAIGKTLERIIDIIKDPLAILKSAFSWLAQQIWETMPKAIKSFYEDTTTLLKKILDVIRDPLKLLKEAYGYLSKQIWEVLPDFIKDYFKTITGLIKKVEEAIVELLTDPVKFIVKVIRKIREIAEDVGETIYNILKTIYETLPDWVKSVIKNIGNALYRIGVAIYHYFTDWKAFWREDVKPLVKDIVENTKDVVEYVRDTISEALDVLDILITPVIQIMEEPTRKFYKEMLSALVKSYRELVGKELEGKLKGIGYEVNIEKQLEEVEKKDGGRVIYETLTATIPMATIIKAIPEMIRSYSYMIDEVMRSLLGFIVGAGMGGHSLTAPLVGIANVLDYVIWGIFRWAAWGITYWVFEPLNEPLRILIRYLYRDVVPFRIPTISELGRITQRRLPFMYVRDGEKLVSAYMEFAKLMLGMHGYPSYLVDMYFKPVKEFKDYDYISIKDRFGKDRKLPTPLIYSLPTPSEMCRMMVKDIFNSLADFKKAIAMHGYIEDIGYMYYLLHFRYPSPERLWDFITRGIAGLLWFEPTDEMKEIAKKEAEVIGAYEPVEPIKLNFQTSKLFEALSTYMKWHDYAKFSWIKGFTSDNWMYIDILADIPTKIDVRWMTKWGIFDFMSSKKIKIDTPVKDFLKVLEDRPVTEQVYMDLTLMSRLLQATGLHPYYVPLVSVAETMNALADERTLVRTGIMNLFEYGLMGYESLDQLMGNLVTATFKVAYLDMKDGKWKTKYMNIPITFLPAERRLIELRSLIDRYLRVFRDVIGDVERAYREYIISEKEGEEILLSFVSVINESFKDTSKEIIGKEISLSLDSNYVKTIFKSLEVERLIYTVRRVRTWFSRMLGWIVYRVAQAYLTPEDADKILQIAKAQARLSDAEIQAIKTVMLLLSAIAGREYIPTPSQLATISEIVPEARRLFNDVVRARRVPPEWIPIWYKYVSIKPIIDDVKRVLSDTMRLYEYFEIDDKAFKDFLETLKKWGYEDYEIKLLIDDGRLRRWHRAYRELIGTPRELVTMAEYSPMARKLALAEVHKMIDALPVDNETKKFLKAMWEEYIRVRPIYDEVRREVTELISDYANGIITWDQFVKFLEELKKWGLDDWEIDAYKFIAMMRRQRYEARRLQRV